VDSQGYRYLDGKEMEYLVSPHVSYGGLSLHQLDQLGHG